MTVRDRVGILGLLLGLLACVPAVAQSGDTALAGGGQADTEESHAEPVVLRTIDDSAVRVWKNDRVFDYANDSAYWRWRELPKTPPSKSSGKAFEYFVLFLMGGVLLYAIINIIVANRLQLFYRPPRRSMVVKAREEEGSPEDDLEGQLMHFMQIKDYRQAVRYLYLKTLRLLDDGGMIRYHQESTNHEYWQQLSATPQAGPFRDLTMIYEQVWYGEFPLGDTLFTRLHEYFEDFYKSVRA